MGNTYLNAVCYPDDTVLIADSEDNLQRLPHSFNQSAKQLNMVVTTDKTKCLVISKEPVKCKLEIDQRMIEQVNQFKYLEADITSSRNLDSPEKQSERLQISVSKANNDIRC
ncbi:putative Si dkeyp-35f12.3 [Trypoxylus dichotomus]